jgi:hypothetical protein
MYRHSISLREERKVLFGYSIVFHQPFFSKGPESFNTIDVNFPLSIFVPMIDIEIAGFTELRKS